MKWPLTTEGAVDWETVFEAPGSGLITLIESADTAVKLEQCVQVVVTSLFSRALDLPVKNQYIERLTAMVDRHLEMHTNDTELVVLTKNIASFLRTLKFDRIKRAKAFLKTGGSGKPTDQDRRDDTAHALSMLDDWLEQSGGVAPEGTP